MSPVTRRTQASVAAARIDAATGRSVAKGSPSSRMKPTLRYMRPRAAHREIVDGAVDGERADVAAGKDQRPHDIGIGGERDRAVDIERRAVMPPIERRVGEDWPDHRVEQPFRRAAAAAMGELDRVAAR